MGSAPIRRHPVFYQVTACQFDDACDYEIASSRILIIPHILQLIFQICNRFFNVFSSNVANSIFRQFYSETGQKIFYRTLDNDSRIWKNRNTSRLLILLQWGSCKQYVGPVLKYRNFQMPKIIALIILGAGDRMLMADPPRENLQIVMSVVPFFIVWIDQMMNSINFPWKRENYSCCVWGFVRMSAGL